MNIEIINPKRPSITIPTADTFAIVSNSCFEGFFNASQTLLDFIVNDFIEFHNFAMFYLENKGF